MSVKDTAAFTKICADRILFLLHIFRKYIQLESGGPRRKSDKQILLDQGKIFKEAYAVYGKHLIQTPEELGGLIDQCFNNNYIQGHSILEKKYSGLLQQLFGFIVLEYEFRYIICDPKVRTM
ncbi:MAG: hypothetical protein WC805_00045 [Patescibacteria group bacterium]